MKNQNLICLDVINTMWYDYRSTGNSEDRLTNPKWVSYFMKDWGLSHLQYPNDHIIKELQALRDLMRGLIKKSDT